jgi:S-(hydroxymethyl)glutathione dehydrogenase/alcohol dehydrogenase
MKAAVLYEAQTPLVIEELDIGEPGPGQVMVKMMASGVCHSDWHVVKGEWTHLPLPIVLGHEGAGIVEATGPGVTNVMKGDHVVLAWRSQCGLCEMCQLGWPALCYNSQVPKEKATVRSTGREINQMAGVGSFGSYQIIAEVAAIPIDKDIPFPQAALVGCGVTTGVGAAINTARVQPGTTAAVFGTGGVGLNVIQGCRIAGATTIIAVDLLDNKLDMAKEFGATHVVNAGKVDAVEAIKSLTDGLGVHYAFEAIGLVEKPFVQSILCTRHRGMSIWVGHAPHGTAVTIDARDLMMEKTVMGSMYGSGQPMVTFPRLFNLYKAGKLKLDELVSRTYPIEKVNDAFEALGKGEVARSTLSFD